MDLSQQLAIIRPRLLLIILVTVIAGVLSFGLASLIPKTYEAHATLLVGQVYDTSQPSQPPQLNYDAFLASEQLATTFAQLAGTRPVLAAVASTLHLSDDPTALRGRVDAVTPPGSLFITISARAANDGDAAALANGVATELLAEAPGILAGSNGTKAAGVVTLVDPAVPAEAVKSPKVTLYAALGALTALIVAVATIFVLAYRETPPFRRAPAARRVGTPEPLPASEPVISTRTTVATVETRPLAPSAGRLPAVSEPPPGPVLLTEVRRPAPLAVTPPASAPAPVRPVDPPLIRTPVASTPANAPASLPASAPAVVARTRSEKPAVTKPATPLAPAAPQASAKPAAQTKPTPARATPAPPVAAKPPAAPRPIAAKAAATRPATTVQPRPADSPKPARRTRPAVGQAPPGD